MTKRPEQKQTWHETCIKQDVAEIQNKLLLCVYFFFHFDIYFILIKMISQRIYFKSCQLHDNLGKVFGTL